MQDKKRQITSNTMYTIAGALVLNGVLQLIVYPRLNARMGTAEIGIVLYIMAFVNILGPSIGQAMNNSRLVLRRDLDVTNGDYNLAILLFGGAGMIISLIMMSGSLIGNGESMHLGIVLPFILSGVLILATIYIPNRRTRGRFGKEAAEELKKERGLQSPQPDQEDNRAGGEEG